MKKLNNLAYRVSIFSIIGNLILSIFKFIAGLIGNSKAMISDAIHSASDILSTIVVMIGIYISSKEPDSSHKYGHERYECVVAIILAVILFFTAITIGYSSLTDINNDKIAIPGIIALIAAILSIIGKEIMYQYTKKAAIKLNSNALLADAWHHRSDAISSIGSLIGIGASRLGLKFCDPLASIIIALCIIKVAYDILKDSFLKMLDTAADQKTENEIIEIVTKNKKVLGIDDLKTRLFGSKMYVDLEISVDSKISLIEAHQIAEDVHHSIEKKFNNCKHCMVHVNPK